MRADTTLGRAERDARRDVFGLWSAWAAGEGEAPTMAEMERVVSSHGLYPVDVYAEAYGRQALMVYMGAAWGVGPKARRLDRLRAWWRSRRG